MFQPKLAKKTAIKTTHSISPNEGYAAIAFNPVLHTLPPQPGSPCW